MPNHFKEGMRVNTKFGPGSISEIRGNNNIIVTLDKGGLKIRQTLNEITSNEKTLPPQDIEKTTQGLPIERLQTSSGNFKNQKAIESLRFGLVPEAKLSEMTIGYDDLKSWIISCLPHSNSGNPTVAEVCGPYGTGKSHTMSVVRHVSRLEGYVTAHVEVDGRSISLGDPEKLLSNLWGSLNAEGLHSSTPLLDLYIKAIISGKSAPRIAPRGVDRIASNYKIIKDLKQHGRLEPFEYMLDAILSSSYEYTATEVNQAIRSSLYDSYLFVRRMIGQKVDDRPFDFIESLFGHAKICEMAVYKGLVVTIDEFEVQHFETHWDRVVRLLELLKKYLSHEMDHPLFPCAVFFATVGQPGHRGDEVVDELIEACNGNYKELEELTRADLFAIAGKLFALYKETYGVNGGFDNAMAEAAYKSVANTSGMVRAFIKNYLASLDRQYGPPRK